MYNILKLNKISPKINDVFTAAYDCNDTEKNPDGIMLRSFNMAEYEVGDKLVAIGRAGAGVNNIPVEKMAEKGIVVFNTPGANANAVKELVLCGMLLASRDIIGGNRWVNTLTEDVAKATEKGKGAFGGYEIFGKTLGVIGLGAIGVLVANACVALGLKVIGYDPYLSDASKAKLNKNVEIADLNTVIEKANIITLHVPLLDSTKGMINADAIAKMQDNVIILNMSRGALVNVADIKKAIADKKVHKYVVDFPDESVLNSDGIIVLPHLGASTEEAEDNCAVMAAEELKDYIENGNIKNSVNYPALNKARTGKNRACILYTVGCPLIEKLKGDVAYATKGQYGYAIVDSDTTIEIPDCNHIIKVRNL